MTAQFELILIFIAVIIGVVSAAYFYVSADIFTTLNALRKPLRYISCGMFITAIGVLLAAFISYEDQMGLQLYFYNLPLQTFFYLLYIIGSLFILLGARLFAYRPKVLL